MEDGGKQRTDIIQRMLKYVDIKEVFAEIPEEITLAIGISNCPIHCAGCHSMHLWNDIGYPLDEKSLSSIVDQHKGITCVLFSGGDNDVKEIEKLSRYMKTTYDGIKVAWYSGREDFVNIDYAYLDYVKLGPYVEKLGPLNQSSTNQRLYHIEHIKNGKAHTICHFTDITNLFWKKDV